jgi:signal transduction histidine kinase
MTQADLLGLLVHELRSPVAALVAIAETLRERREELGVDDRRRLLELGLAAGRDVERIVVDATPASLRLEEVDPAALVSGVVAATQLRGEAVVAELDGPLSPVTADPVRLRQALANLIANAVAHSPPGAQVVVRAGVVAGELRLAVTDAGEGIPVEDQERIFDPGVRLTGRPGQGLGLAVARAVAEAHGGTLEVESASGQGACFTLVLPAAASARA